MGSHLRTGDKDRVWFDFFDIACGGMEKLSFARHGIHPDGLFERFYGRLCDYLEGTHEVRRFAYDWRQGLEDTANKLAGAIDEALHSFSSLISRTRRRDIGAFTTRKPRTEPVPFTPEQEAVHDAVLAVHRAPTSSRRPCWTAWASVSSASAVQAAAALSAST